jgi:hypothetical protein
MFLHLYSEFILTIAIIIIDCYYYYHCSEITIIVLGWLLCPPKVTTANSNQKIIDIIISIYLFYISPTKHVFLYYCNDRYDYQISSTDIACYCSYY